MTDQQAGQSSNRFEIKVSAESHFSWLRTRLSIERTLMSWVRTATALIGFGFTIVQFFQRMQDMRGVESARHPEAARYLGLALIAAGVIALAVSVWQYRSLLNYLFSTNFAPVAGIAKDRGQTPLMAVAVALLLIGIFAFAAVLLRFT